MLPSGFIPVAEDASLIMTLGWWVLKEACRQVREWQERYPAYSILLVSVNLSGWQFEHKDLARDIAQALEETKLDPGVLGFEITESVAMQDAEETVAVFGELKGLGVKLIIDDFGTGYSSLSYLRRFLVDFLKIDGSFVAGLGESPGDEVVVSGITGLAHAMGIPLIAEEWRPPGNSRGRETWVATRDRATTSQNPCRAKRSARCSKRILAGRQIMPHGVTAGHTSMSFDASSG